MSWQRKLGLGIAAGLAVLVAVSYLEKTPDNEPYGTEPAASSGEASMDLVPSESSCRSTGIDDVYTGDGHVTFYVTVTNNGSADGTANITPVRHYSDGESNESAMDVVSVDVPAHETKRFRTTAMTYKAHSHAIIGCGLRVGSQGEVAINAR